MFEEITDLLPTLQEKVLCQLDETRIDEDGRASAPCSFGLFWNWFVNGPAISMDRFEKTIRSMILKHNMLPEIRSLDQLIRKTNRTRELVE